MKTITTKCTCDVCGSDITNDYYESSGSLSAQYKVRHTVHRYEDICIGCQVAIEDAINHISAARKMGTDAAQIRIALDRAFKAFSK